MSLVILSVRVPSRTAIIALRMSFHVCRFIITALGNMQPSQHTWRNRLVSSPLFVAQPEAGITRDVELAVGIVGQAVPARLVVRAAAMDRTIGFGLRWKSIVQGRNAAVNMA